MSATTSWEVLAIRTGHRVASRARVYLNYFYYGEPDGDMPMDYFFWVARNGEHTVVIDTGFNEHSGASRGRTMLTTPADALAILDIDPSAVDHVVLTHLHYDHSGNTDLFDQADFWIAEDEIGFWTGEYGQRPLFAAASEADDVAAALALDDAGRLHRTRGDVEVLPGLRIIEVGGHTAGQTVVSIDTAKGEVLLASDAVHYFEEFERDRPFTETADLAGTYAAFDRVRERVEAGATLVPGHDPLVMTLHPPARPDHPELAVIVSESRQE